MRVDPRAKRPQWRRPELPCASWLAHGAAYEKAYFDSVGHYARWDLLDLVIREDAEALPRALDTSSARLRDAAERYEVSLARLEAMVERMAELLEKGEGTA